MKTERAEIDEFLNSLKGLMSTESMGAADENAATRNKHFKVKDPSDV